MSRLHLHIVEGSLIEARMVKARPHLHSDDQRGRLAAGRAFFRALALPAEPVAHQGTFNMIEHPAHIAPSVGPEPAS